MNRTESETLIEQYVEAYKRQYGPDMGRARVLGALMTITASMLARSSSPEFWAEYIKKDIISVSNPPQAPASSQNGLAKSPAPSGVVTERVQP